MLWNSIKGSPRALARLVAVAVGVIVTLSGELLRIPGLGHVGDAFLGAAVAMFMDLVAQQLESDGKLAVDQLPALDEFSAAIRTELVVRNFYRERQIVKITLENGIVDLDFRSKIVLIDKNGGAVIRKQKIIDVPRGLRKMGDVSYAVDGVAFSDDMDEYPISRDSSDRISIRYGVEAQGGQVIEDSHYWASFVREYQIIFSSSTHRCEMARVRGTSVLTLLEDPPGIFHSAGAALSGEQVRWKLTSL